MKAFDDIWDKHETTLEKLWSFDEDEALEVKISSFEINL